MRALAYDCGQHLEASDDQKLFGEAQKHMNRDHPEMQLSDKRVRETVTEKAYDKKPDLLARIDIPPQATAFMGGGGMLLVARGLSSAKNHRTACRRTGSKQGRKAW